MEVRDYRERPRLSAQLDVALDDTTRLTLLSAPPGYGKTVAVAGWFARRGMPFAWLSLDPADNDLARFARYLAAALRSVRPDAGAAMLGLFGPATNATPDLVGAIVVEAMAANDEPLVLVLDDYHVVTAEPIQRLVRDDEVVHEDPFPGRPSDGARGHRCGRGDELLLLGVDADDRLAQGQLQLHGGVQVAELGIAVGVVVPSSTLRLACRL